MTKEILFRGSKLPFEPCPGTPNCHIDYLDIRDGVDKGLAIVHRILKQMGAGKISIQKNKFDAEFRVFVFVDDFKVVVEANQTGSRIWVRNSSRIGHSDLGVNKRRVTHFFSEIKKSL
jgi:uncharacterized protein (DUF1499 family)